MAIELITKVLPYVDEIFTTESKSSLVTNQDFDFTGAKTVKVYKVGTAPMNDYNRTGAVSEGSSRYGTIQTLDATTEEFTLTKDRSFTFAIDKLDEDETGGAVAGASALARQLRQVVVPEVDANTFSVMSIKAGTKPTAIELTKANIYSEILKGNKALDDEEVPDVGRVILLTPESYLLLKENPDIKMSEVVAEELTKQGVIAMLDGCAVIKVPPKRVAAEWGFMIAHPVATVAPEKLAEYIVHENPQFISGSLVEGRINYDALVLEEKAKAIYYQATT